MSCTRNNDLCMCRESIFSHFIQVGGLKLVQMDLQPFLTQSQLDGGFDSQWFSSEHLEEILQLLKPLLDSCITAKNDVNSKKVDKSKDCVLTGATVRVACVFKLQPDHNICLITQYCRKKTSQTAETRHKQESIYQQMQLHKEKVVVYVCPRASSSVLQLSQLVCDEPERNRNLEDISKYFSAPKIAAASSSSINS